MVRGSDTAIRLSYSMRATAPKAVREMAMREIGSAFLRFGGDVSQASKYLGIGRATLHRWLKEHAYLRKLLESARTHGPA